MKRSTHRTQTTHVGSIPRPDSLVDYMIAEDKGEAFDTAAFETALTQAVSEVVGHQKTLGIDTVSDGEFSKRGFAVYAHERLAGLEETGRSRPSP
jgi:5-methyltetrahydropteroyltriglutamate--homocysteine methyltransferase